MIPGIETIDLQVAIERPCARATKPGRSALSPTCCPTLTFIMQGLSHLPALRQADRRPRLGIDPERRRASLRHRQPTAGPRLGPPPGGRLGPLPPDRRSHATHHRCAHHDLGMGRPRRADAAAFLHDRQRHRGRRHGLDRRLPLPRLAGGRNRMRRRHHRHRQRGARARTRPRRPSTPISSRC